MTMIVQNIQLDGLYVVYTLIHSCEESVCCHARLTLKYKLQEDGSCPRQLTIGQQVSVVVGS